MTHMKELDVIVGELDATASVAQSNGGTVSWRKVREIAFRLATVTIGKSLISKGNHEYLKEHHSITSSYIGLAKMALLRNNPLKAMEYLQLASTEIDGAVLKHLPEHHAALQGLRVEKKETENAQPTVD